MGKELADGLGDGDGLDGDGDGLGLVVVALGVAVLGVAALGVAVLGVAVLGVLALGVVALGVAALGVAVLGALLELAALGAPLAEVGGDAGPVAPGESDGGVVDGEPPVQADTAAVASTAKAAQLRTVPSNRHRPQM